MASPGWEKTTSTFSKTYSALKGRLKRAGVENPKNTNKPRSASEPSAGIPVICLLFSALAATLTAALMQNRFQKCATLMTPTLRPVRARAKHISSQRRKGQFHTSSSTRVMQLFLSRSRPRSLPATVHHCSLSVAHKQAGEALDWKYR